MGRLLDGRGVRHGGIVQFEDGITTARRSRELSGKSRSQLFAHHIILPLHSQGSCNELGGYQ